MFLCIHTSLGDTGHSNFIHVFVVSSCFCVFVALSVFVCLCHYWVFVVLEIFADFLVYFCCFCNGDEQVGSSLTWPQTTKQYYFSWPGSLIVYTLFHIEYCVVYTMVAHYSCLPFKRGGGGGRCLTIMYPQIISNQIIYSKPCLKRSLKKKTKNWFSRPIIA